MTLYKLLWPWRNHEGLSRSDSILKKIIKGLRKPHSKRVTRMAPMATNRVWLSLFTMLLLVLGLNRRSLAMGWAILPVHYTFNVENALSKAAFDVHCSSNTKEGDLGVEHVPLHGNYVHRFMTGLVTTVSYDCTLTIPGDRAFKVLQVFTDAQKFVDEQCGGRHCFWKVQDDGIYLYQIHQGQYIKRYTWDHV